MNDDDVQHFNLLMVGAEGYWETSPASLPLARVFEYTEKSIADLFRDGSGKIDEAIVALPCLFAYEFPAKAAAKIGKITKIEVSGKEVSIFFVFDEELPPIPSETIENLEWELQIEKFERYRTHWAVKNGNIYDILATEGIIKKSAVSDSEIKRVSDVLSGQADISTTENSSTERLKIFVSYSHRDTEFLERLKTHFKSIRRNVDFDLWEDTRILTGDQWRTAIEDALNACSVAILLISADFLASDFISEVELPIILQRAHNNGVRIVPIVVKPCLFDANIELSSFQAINDPKLPLAGMDEVSRESLYTRVVRTALLL